MKTARLWIRLIDAKRLVLSTYLFRLMGFSGICITYSPLCITAKVGNRVLVWTISQKSLNHTSMDHDFLQKNMPNVGDVNALFSCLDLHRFSTNF